jgi:protein SCO1/2
MQTHTGQTVRFYDDLLKGKVAMINFMFTECDGVCPGMTQNLADVQGLLGDRVGREIFMYSISIDPARDTPEKLAQYAAPFDIGPGWLFLTGKKADVEMLRARLGFVDSDPRQDANPDEHTGTVRIGNEPLHRWIMAPGLANPAAIVRAVERVIPG